MPLDLILVTPPVEMACGRWGEGPTGKARDLWVVSREGLMAMKSLRGSGQDQDDLKTQGLDDGSPTGTKQVANSATQAGYHLQRAMLSHQPYFKLDKKYNTGYTYFMKTAISIPGRNFSIGGVPGQTLGYVTKPALYGRH